MSQLFINRRSFLAATSTAATVTLLDQPILGQPLLAKEVANQSKLAWHDVTEWGVEGKGWQETARYFDRLPAKAKNLVRPAVWNLSRHSAGMLCRFETDATTIHTRYELLSASVAMAHMPATGVSGIDLYVRDPQGLQRWVGVTRPTAKKVEATLAKNLDPSVNGLREFAIYLPLYNGIESLEIGVPEGATLKSLSPREEKPLVFYGTSIMHGACASRPGMSITGIVGRRLNRPVINLGFSGNGRMEAEVAHLLAELDAKVYLIDCLPNINGQQVAERTEPLVHILRKARPKTPIVLVEDRTYSNAHIFKSSRTRHAASRAALAKAYKNLQNEGVKNVHYLAGDLLLSNDSEATTDGSHPSDLGMAQYADAYQTILEKILS
jgi:lysophospholipase L1-like esterase